MNFKDLGLYTGVLEFFSIFLPGSILVLVACYFEKSGVYALFVVGKDFLSFYFGLTFFILSYILGHLVFQLGSFLDNIIYDKIKGQYGYDQNLAYLIKIRENKFSENLKGAKELYGKARVKNEINPLKSGKKPDQFWHVDNFTWSTLYLLEHNPKLYNEVERLMADSKFFRGLFIVSLILMFAHESLTDGDLVTPVFWAVIISITLLSLFLYIHVRHKSTKKAYKYVVYLEELRIPLESAKKTDVTNNIATKPETQTR